MYEALHQRAIRVEVITGERNSSHGINTNLPTQSTLDGVEDFYFCCNNVSPDGIDVQAGLTGRMVQQRNVGGFLVFLVCGVWFNLQELRFIPTYFVAFFVRMLG
jgi:hypothetical protein